MMVVPEAVHILCAVRSADPVRRFCRKMDDGERCLIEIVADGKQAIESCSRYMPDILVLDGVLPEIDGLGVVDYVRAMPTQRKPRIIGGASSDFSNEGFRRRGADAVLRVPWQETELAHALMEQMHELECCMDWQALEKRAGLADMLLRKMGMHSELKGFTYLSWAAALACESEGRLHAVNSRIYEPIAVRFQTTTQNVERLIRHALESTMNDAQAKGVYLLFGNTIDPAKGKPTNAQSIALLAQRLRGMKNE